MKSLMMIALLFSLNAFAEIAPHKGYIVKLRKPISQRSLSTLSNLGIKVEKTIPEIDVIVTDADPEKINKLVKFNDIIEYVEPNYYVKSYARKDIYDNESDGLWGLRQSFAADAWRMTTGNESVVVAVSDTGVWFDHLDLQKSIWYNAGEQGTDANGKDKASNKVDDDKNGFVDDYAGWNFESNTNNPTDTHYHGTHVAGTIGAQGGDGIGIAGVSWKVKIMALKFLSNDGYGTVEGGIGTIIYAAKMGAKAVNCSWGGDPYSQALFDAIEYAKSKNMVVVAAAGNDSNNNDKTPDYPAAYSNDNVITVAATQAGNKQLAIFSNFGAKSVDLAAPGEGILSTINPLAKSPYKCMSKWYCHLDGTSMAAPHVTGTIALMYSVNPNLTYTQIKDILISGSTKQKKLAGKVVSGGTLQMCNSVKLAQSLAE